jgi:hypothetical protein
MHWRFPLDVGERGRLLGRTVKGKRMRRSRRRRHRRIGFHASDLKRRSGNLGARRISKGNCERSTGVSGLPTTAPTLMSGNTTTRKARRSGNSEIECQSLRLELPKLLPRYLPHLKVVPRHPIISLASASTRTALSPPVTAFAVASPLGQALK